MTTITDRRRAGRLTALLLTGAVLLAACGASDDSGFIESAVDRDTAGSDAAMEEGMAAPEAVEEPASDGDIGPGPVPPPAGGPAPEGMERAVIRTGTMHIRATDTAEVADEVVEVVVDAEGYVAGTDLSRNADGVVQGSFTFRVPTESLTEVLDAFDALADAVLTRRLDETDVTTQLVDLQAEITNLEAFEAELRELLTEVRESGAEAEELLTVFERLNDVRGQIDQAQARRAQLTDQVAMSTIYLQLSPTASTGPVGDPGWDPGGTARSALAATVRALTSLADGAIRIGLTILPITLVLLAPVALLIWLLRRWWKRRPRPEPTPPPAPAWTAPMPPPPSSDVPEQRPVEQQPAEPATAPSTPGDEAPDDDRPAG